MTEGVPLTINILGGGPAGLYFAILMKRQNPSHQITVIERDGPNDTFGWGIVFSDKTFAFLEENDRESFGRIAAESQVWDNVDVVHRGERISVRGNDFSGIARLKFLNILHRRCAELGVELRFNTNITPEALADLSRCDLLVGADGANSLVRQWHSGFFMPSVDVRQNKYIWLGTPQLFHGLTMIFKEAEAGLFIAHAYKFNPDTSTFIVECPPNVWQRAGFEAMSEQETCRYLETAFQYELNGHPLWANNFVRWLNFPLVKTKRWWHKNTVLLGDALHTAHFSIGSGTKLALEDSIALARAFANHGAVAKALPAFERDRKPVVDKFQHAALNSLVWLEQVQQHLTLEPLPFTYRLMTRSKRIGYRRLKRSDAAFIEQYDLWRNAQPKAGPIPADFLDLFQKKAIGHLATLMPDGTPHVTSVWVDYDGRHILINSAQGRQKDLNMERYPDVAIEIVDPDNDNRYVAVRGKVVSITEEGADEHLDSLARRYLNRDSYPAAMRFRGEARRLYRIEPHHVATWDPFG